MVSKVLEREIANAITVLQKGGVVVFPTETAYGLASDSTNPAAVNRVFAMKGRQKDKALPLIAADLEMVERVATIPSMLRGLCQQHWPGPLTLVLPVMGERLAAGVARDSTVAIRVSLHPIAQALSAGLGRPIVSTSANRSGQPACYSVEAVKKQFEGREGPDVYLDVGSLHPEPPSTIVTVDEDGYLEVVRQGSIEL